MTPITAGISHFERLAGEPSGFGSFLDCLVKGRLYVPAFLFK
jgi:hypothetical protein